jgi:hypothetical protein
MEVGLLWVLCVVKRLCDELIIRAEEFYRVWWGNHDPLGVASKWKEKLSVCLSIYLSVCVFVRVSVCLSVCLLHLYQFPFRFPSYMLSPSSIMKFLIV